MSPEEMKSLLLDIDAAFDGGGDIKLLRQGMYGKTTTGVRQPAIKSLGTSGWSLRLRILKAAEELRNQKE